MANSTWLFSPVLEGGREPSYQQTLTRATIPQPTAGAAHCTI